MIDIDSNNKNENENVSDELENTPLNENELEQVSEDTIDENTKTKKVDPLFVTNVVVNSIFYLFIFILLLFSISQIAGSKDDKVKNVFGLGYEIVLSNSMEPEFKANDLVWVNTNVKKSNLKIGTIITFWDTSGKNNPTNNPEGFINTHRIVDIVYMPDSNKVSAYVCQGDVWKTYENGKYDYNTKTDDEKATMRYKQEYVQIVSPSDVRAKYIGHWDGAGSFIKWLSNPKKGFVFVILITGAFLIFEMFMVIKNVMEIRTANMQANSEAEKEELKKSLEAERERMKQELLAELKAESEANKKEEKEDESSNDEEKDETE